MQVPASGLESPFYQPLHVYTFLARFSRFRGILDAWSNVVFVIVISSTGASINRWSRHDDLLVSLSLYGTPAHSRTDVPLKAIPVRPQILCRFLVQRIRCIGFEEQKLCAVKVSLEFVQHTCL